MTSVVFIVTIPFEEKQDTAKTINENHEENALKCEEWDSSRENKEQDSKVNNDSNVSNDSKVNNDSKNPSKTMPDDDRSASAAEKNIPSEADEDHLEEFSTPLNIREVLKNELKSLNVKGDAWHVTNDDQFYQVIFVERSGERIEKILEKLTYLGIGFRPKSSVSIIPTSVHIQSNENLNVVGQGSPGKEDIHNLNNEAASLLGEKESAKDKFIKSIKSRLTVEQVVEGVKLQAKLTFDFVMFTVLASFIAAVGLVEDNAVVLVASMLVSPLMGPILGGTFGTVIKNRSLRNTGLKTELCGLGLSVLVGFLFGLISGPVGLNGASWNSNKHIWPTNEMTSRSMLRALWVGVLIALPSGAGVALSVLGGNTGSLVGVAISASLLPPAVNSGMLWAYSIISAIKPPETLAHSGHNVSWPDCPPLKSNSYVPMYSCELGTEAAIMAVISLVLTVVNIICIFITATLVLKIKEVTPKASSSTATQKFWTKDIKVAREEIYTAVQGDSAVNLLKEWKKFNAEQTGSKGDSYQEGDALINIIEEVEENEEFQSVVRRAPRGAQNLHKFSRNLKRLVSNEEVLQANRQAMMLDNQLKNLQTHYSLQPTSNRRQPHVQRIFEESSTESKPNGVREFHVTDIENPHHSSVVRVRQPTDDSSKYSVLTESGV